MCWGVSLCHNKKLQCALVLAVIECVGYVLSPPMRKKISESFSLSELTLAGNLVCSVTRKHGQAIVPQDQH